MYPIFKKAMIEHYYTHDNGGYAFKVEYDSERGEVRLFRPSVGVDYEREPSYTIARVEGVRLPEDPQEYPRMRDNSLLVVTCHGKVLYCIHNAVERITLGPNERVLGYFSPVWGSDVSYPWIRTNLADYAVAERVRLPSSFVLGMKSMYKTPYDPIYALTTGPIMDKFHSIHAMNNAQTVLTRNY